jgi:hypothetical protein
MIHTLAAGIKIMYLASSSYGDETTAPAFATLTSANGNGNGNGRGIVQPGVAV